MHAIIRTMYHVSACATRINFRYSGSKGGIPIMLSAELFRQGPRPYAMSLVGVVHWLGVLAISVSYEFIQVS